MILIEATREPHKNEIVVQVTGHAGYSEPGTDIVCAAVSALALALHAWATDKAETKEQVRKDGVSFIRMKATQRTETAVELFLAGALSIYRDYPEYISVETFEKIFSEF